MFAPALDPVAWDSPVAIKLSPTCTSDLSASGCSQDSELQRPRSNISFFAKSGHEGWNIGIEHSRMMLDLPLRGRGFFKMALPAGGVLASPKPSNLGPVQYRFDPPSDSTRGDRALSPKRIKD